MSTDDVTRILVRLGVIEAKLDGAATDSNRVRRLEVAVVLLAGMQAKTAFAQIVSLVGG